LQKEQLLTVEQPTCEIIERCGGDDAQLRVHLLLSLDCIGS
jgi:hypothetical protein